MKKTTDALKPHRQSRVGSLRMRQTLRTNPHSSNIPRHVRQSRPTRVEKTGAMLFERKTRTWPFFAATLRRPTAGDSGSSAFPGDAPNLTSFITVHMQNRTMTIHMSVSTTTWCDVRHAAGASCFAGRIVHWLLRITGALGPACCRHPIGAPCAHPAPILATRPQTAVSRLIEEHQNAKHYFTPNLGSVKFLGFRLGGF